MAKLLKLRRGTTSQHSSFTGAEGEVTVDTDKDVLVVHDGSTAGGHPVAAQDMDNVPAGAILGTQLENSGVTAGQYGSSSAIPIVTVDAQGLVTAASTTAIDSTTIANGSSSVSVANNGAITSNANHDFSAGIDVTGNITATGTVDGRDVAADGSKLDTYEANGSSYIRSDANDSASGSYSFTNSYNEFGDGTGSVSNDGSWNARVNIAGSNHGRLDVKSVSDGIIATMSAHNGHGKAYMGTRSSGHSLGLYSGGSERATLSTAGSLSTTVQGTLWGASNDGSGSGLDADTLDGVQGSSYARSDADDTLSGDITFSNSGQYPVVIGSSSGMHDGRLLLRGSSNPYIRFREGNSDKAYIQWNASGFLQLSNEETNEHLRIKSGTSGLKFLEGSSEYTVWHAGNDGASSGLDADLLDGQHGSHYLNYNNLSNKPTIPTNNNQLSNGAGYVTVSGYTAGASVSFSQIDVTGSHGIDNESWYRNDDSGDGMYNTGTTQHFYSDHDDYWNMAGGGAANALRFRDDHNGSVRGYCYADSSNAIGFLDQGGSWALRTKRSSSECTLYDMHFRSDTNGSYDLGSSSARWRNVYTSDLDLSNEAKGVNDIDGTWGHYTIVEGESDLFLKNNRSGKTYKFNLTEVS